MTADNTGDYTGKELTGNFIDWVCALGGIRTPNNCFEGSDDIHFTTRAYDALIIQPIRPLTMNELQ